MSVVAAGRTATQLADGSVLMVVFPGGELFDPSEERFHLLGNMCRGRSYHSATLLNDGTVLIGGGLDAAPYVDTLELYVPPKE